MLQKLKLYWLAIMASQLLLQACSEPKAAAPATKKFFDLEGNLNAQATYLSQAPVTIFKQVTINGEQESLQLKQLDWEKEFTFFIEADINKPAWRNSFLSDSIVDQAKGLKTVVHTSRDEDVSVNWLKLNYSLPENRLQSLEAKVAGSNMFYASGRLMHIDYFYDNADSLRIKGYELSGYQKMMLQDSVSFAVKATIDYGSSAK